jgi:outer membrane protein OmpA-like peptidoglycan-associated protein
MKISNYNLAVALAVTAILVGCSSQPAQIDSLATARSAVQQVESSPDAGKYAAAEVTAAHEALKEAERLVEKKKPKSDIEQAAYLAKRHADVATEQIARGQAEQKTAEAEAARQKVVSQAREQEAVAAKQQAEVARQQADADKQQAQLSAEDAQRNAASLEAQLRDLQAKQTDRGLVLTLGDVLFDSGQATLKPGAASTIDRLAAFLTQSPERSVAIEGHTDSMGSDSYNLSLSENRANSVKAALVAKGIQAQRIVAVGKGEGVPVASNDNSAGRQQNRRVEIIVSNPTELAHRQ